MTKFIPVFQPVFQGNEKKYLQECIDSGWIGSNGQFVKKLENDFSLYCNQKYGSCLSSGTAALDIVLKAMKALYKWEDNSEIIIPSFNIISAAQGCVLNKLKPVFVDARKDDWNIDADKIEELITNKTKAIVVVHIYGLPCDMDKILKIAKKYNLKIIEDAAQAHGQTHKGKMCGSFGNASIFSFYTNKNVACGEGGIALTSDKKLSEKINYYKNLCFTSKRFIHQDIGNNYRMSNLQAAVACAQLEKIEDTIKRKIHIGTIYQNLLKDIPAQLPLIQTSYAKNHYWVFGIVINRDCKLKAQDAISKLKQEGIETRPFFFPMHKQPVFKKLGILDNIKKPVSEYLYKKGFYIPVGLNLSDKDLEYISNKIKKIF